VEVTGAPLAWYIDAWAVRDGVAFASARPAESVDARNTIFLSVPDLQPTPVGRITTALGATRRGFQAGLRDFEGVEVAFDNIAQVREVVRRGYLAGGLGPGGAASPAFSLPPAEPGGVGGAHFERAVGESPWLETRWYHEGDRDLLWLPRQVPPAELARLVKAFAEATVLEWEQALEEGRVSHLDYRLALWGLREWCMTLVSRAVWTDAEEFAEFVVYHHCRVARQLLDASAGGAVTSLQFGGSLAPEHRRFSDQDLLQSAPCPLLPHWNPLISRLLDKLLLPLADASYFPHNPEVRELIPALLTAVLSVPAPPSIHAAFGDGVSGEEMVHDALGWLATQTPQVELPPVAEMLISRYAWDQLEALPRSVPG
jgi:hypothetical protein